MMQYIHILCSTHMTLQIQTYSTRVPGKVLNTQNEVQGTCVHVHVYR